MEEYQLRVFVEKAELDLKIHKLRKFLEKDSVTLTILERQLVIMSEYSEILQERINSWV